jgi:hypothetical protein
MLTGRLGDREMGRGIDGFYQNLKVCDLNSHQLTPIVIITTGLLIITMKKRLR